MGYALFEELKLALRKIDNDALASASATIVESVKSRRAQVSLGNKALDQLNDSKSETNAMPFILCYIITGLSTISILASGEKEKKRVNVQGNQLPNNPRLQAHVQRIGFSPDTAKAYRDNRERGFSIHNEGRYRTFVTDKELSKYP